MGPNVEGQESQLRRRAKELENELEADKGRSPIVSPVPERPTDSEVLEHNVTHSPAKPWCPHCVKGTAGNDPHRAKRKEVPDVEVVMEATPTISIDLMYLYDKGERPTLVVVDRESGRVWSYAVRDTTILGGTGWIQKKLA